MNPQPANPGERGSVSRLPARRAVTSPGPAPDPIDAVRMERMIDAVQALGQQLAETQRTLQVFVEQLTAAAQQHGVLPDPAQVALPAPAALRPSVGMPVRRPEPPAPVDPNARPEPPAVLSDHVRAPGEEPDDATMAGV